MGAEVEEQGTLTSAVTIADDEGAIASSDSESELPGFAADAASRSSSSARKLLGGAGKGSGAPRKLLGAEGLAREQKILQRKITKQRIDEITNELKGSTEGKVLQIFNNVSKFDQVCQFVTKECANAASIRLAQVLRDDAEAVTNPTITSDELRQVSEKLAELHSNARTMLNATQLPRLGDGWGTCALLTDAEFKEDGTRYDSSVSRFASVIDMHDTLVHCPTNKHYCRFIHRNEFKTLARELNSMTRRQYERYAAEHMAISDVKLRLDAQSYLLAVRDGQRIHEVLSADPDLGDGVVHWGSTSKPTHAFVTTLMLLRASICDRVDIYGQPGVPLSWFRASGLGQLVVAPGPSPEELELAKILVQERYFYRVAMHSERLCFFK